MKNTRITSKERGLIKGALRRVFSRSELRQRAIARSRIEHKDDSRPRVTKWSQCVGCNKKVPQYKMEVDHIQPVIPIFSSLEEMNFNDIIDRLWCDEEGLVAICPDCHKVKTSEENKTRRVLKKQKKEMSKK